MAIENKPTGTGDGGPSHLKKDLGVTAFIAIETVTGVFAIIIIALLKGLVGMDILLPIIGGWVGTVLGAYFTLKAAKQASNHRE